LQFCTLAILAGGLLGMLIGGLAAVMRHYLLRFWLWQTRMFPWHTVRFLDDATSRILLRRIVGGYSFAHRLILDHFAFMDTTPTSSVFLLSSNPVPSLICSACGCQETRPGAKFCPRCGGMLA
jgi:hypothetical protein